MKLFDLEAAKRGEPVQCCGLTAKFVAYESEACPYEQVMYLGHGNQLFTADVSGKGFGRHSLLMAPKKSIVWVNFYTNPERAYYYRTKECAEVSVMNGRIGDKSYPVEIEI